MPSSYSRSTRLEAVLLSVLFLAGCTEQTASPQPTSTGPSLTTNYSLLIHCGIRYASFDGDSWDAVAPIPAIPESVSDGNGMRNRTEVAGNMVRLSATQAQFTTTEPPIGLVVHVVRSTATIPACA